MSNHIFALGVVFMAVCSAMLGCGDSDTEPEATTSMADGGQDTAADAVQDSAAEEDSNTTVEDSGVEADMPTELLGTDPMTWPLGEDGPYNTGFRTWELTYNSPATGEPRTLKLNVWYPTLDEEGEPTSYLGLGAFTDRDVRTDAALAEPIYEGRFPLLVHSHGHLGFGGGSSDLMRHVASHGWVAVAPDHTNNTLLDNIDPKPTAIFVHRPSDISAVLDGLEGLDAGDPLANLIDTSKVVLSGHSFGVYTTWASGGARYDLEHLRGRCEEGDTPIGNWSAECTEQELAAFEAGLGEPRVAAIVPMAGGYDEDWFGATGYRAVSVPMLLMTGSEDGDSQTQEWEQTSELTGSIWINLEGGVHETFGLCGMLDPEGTELCSTLHPEEGYHVVNTYALAFARHHVLGDTTQSVMDVLTGATVLDKVAFEQR